MVSMIPRHIPCSVCGKNSFRHDGWFLVVDNRWLDRLSVLTWHSSFASREGIKSACSRQHLKTLVAHWLEQASLRFAAESPDQPVPITSDATREDADLGPPSNCPVVSELSVCRETFSRMWTGSPAARECILEALIPAGDESPNPELPVFNSRHGSLHGLALH